MRDLLVPLLIVEVGILALLFLLLVGWPLLVRVVEARRGRQRRDLVTAVWRHRSGDLPASVVTALANARPKALLRSFEAIEEAGLEPVDLNLDRLVRGTPAFRRLERAARSRFWLRRQTAAQLLGHVGQPDEDRTLLVSLLRDDHPAVYTSALLSARELGWPGLAEPLLDLALEAGHGNRGEEALIAEILGDLDADVVPLLRERLEAHAGEPGELTHLRIAGRLADERLRPLLTSRLREGGLETRIQAARALAAEPHRGAVDQLRRALRDPAWQVRTQAARALGELQAVEAVDDLRRSLTDPSWWVRLRAAVALRRLGPRGRRELEAVDADVDQYAADMAEYVLGLEEDALSEFGR